ncbi:hypothetical protein BCR39DRAFT_587280 [Naematelia encephala]|uniref:Uncharacterized protein n=1 Tax=Naematelia encephala TaxID=71784 RepID=A0A1Y2BCE4_9TREE|nr:hypothetical protein BCR39DRAFT_587280 [Naematelia encephala]
MSDPINTLPDDVQGSELLPPMPAFLIDSSDLTPPSTPRHVPRHPIKQTSPLRGSAVSAGDSFQPSPIRVSAHSDGSFRTTSRGGSFFSSDGSLRSDKTGDSQDSSSPVEVSNDSTRPILSSPDKSIRSRLRWFSKSRSRIGAELSTQAGSRNHSLRDAGPVPPLPNSTEGSFADQERARSLSPQPALCDECPVPSSFASIRRAESRGPFGNWGSTSYYYEIPDAQSRLEAIRNPHDHEFYSGNARNSDPNNPSDGQGALPSREGGSSLFKNSRAGGRSSEDRSDFPDPKIIIRPPTRRS